MAFTRFNYDKCRTAKFLQETTGPGRYMLNTPGIGCKPCYTSDPQVRLQKWGGNLRYVPGGHPIDIDSDLIGLTRKLTHDCTNDGFPKKGVVISEKVNYVDCKTPITDQSRVTHPVWLYRDLEQTRWYPLFLDPQENTCKQFENNLNTRILEKDNFIPKIPCPRDFE